MRKVCAFFGHRDTSSKIEPLIEKQIRRLIIEKGVNTFWIGGYGWFDIYASGILRKLKREYPNIHIVFLFPLSLTSGRLCKKAHHQPALKPGRCLQCTA